MNRGCTVIVQLLNPSSGGGASSSAGAAGGGSDISEEISLQVALHTPLGIFKSRLQDICGISADDQVLILCDLTDSDRNNDVHLGADYDNISLRDCRIRANSVLTLHALGVSAEKRALLLKDAADQKESQVEAFRKKTNGTAVLATPVTAAQADHSFNGIIFDLQSRGAYEVNIYSLSVAGMLGRVRIYARDRSWEEDAPNSDTQHHWGHHPGVSRHGWTLVADQVCRPAWDRPTEIFFTTPFRILPHETRGFYIHSGLPDDLGIQYRSCKPDTMVCQDDCLTVLPGLGHCGSRPFDHVNGWFRHGRCPCGSIRYKANLKGWNKNEHHSFPEPFREGVVAMLASFYSAGSAGSPYSSSSPRYVPGHEKSGFNVATAREIEWGNSAIPADAVSPRTPSTGLASMSIEGEETEDDASRRFQDQEPSTDPDQNSSPPSSPSSKKERPPGRSRGGKQEQGGRPRKEARKMRTDSEEEAYLMEQADADDQMDAMFGEAAEEEEDVQVQEQEMNLQQEKISSPLAAGGSFTSSSSAVPSPFSPGELSLSVPIRRRPALGILNEKYLIYYIMSFCHWDWFEEVEIARRKEAEKQRRAEARENASNAAEARRARGGMTTRSQLPQSAELSGTSTGLSRVDQMRAMVAQVLTSYGVEDVTEDIITMFMSNMLGNQGHEEAGEDEDEGEEDGDYEDVSSEEQGEQEEEEEDEEEDAYFDGDGTPQRYGFGMHDDDDDDDDGEEEEEDEEGSDEEGEDAAGDDMNTGDA